MERAQRYFSVEYGISTGDFTVLVGTSFEVFAPLYKRFTGWELAYLNGAWVQPGIDGTIMVIMQGYDQACTAGSCRDLNQGQGSTDNPAWMTEGAASFADLEYTLSSHSPSDRRNFSGNDGRYAPCFLTMI